MSGASIYMVSDGYFRNRFCPQDNSWTCIAQKDKAHYAMVVGAAFGIAAGYVKSISSSRSLVKFSPIKHANNPTFRLVHFVLFFLHIIPYFEGNASFSQQSSDSLPLPFQQTPTPTCSIPQESSNLPQSRQGPRIGSALLPAFPASQYTVGFSFTFGRKEINQPSRNYHEDERITETSSIPLVTLMRGTTPSLIPSQKAAVTRADRQIPTNLRAMSLQSSYTESTMNEETAGAEKVKILQEEQEIREEGKFAII
jgi:hypothetical protein